MKFIWDKKKETINIKKHKINFTDASLVFLDPFAIYNNDASHSILENREIAIGEILGTKIIVVCFVERNPNEELIRIFSARPAERKEINTYNKRKG